MAKTLQFRRGTTSELSSVTGSVGELFVNTEKDTVVVMDGSTSGGFELTQNTATQTLTNKTLSSAVLTGTLTAGGGVGTSGQVLKSTGTGVEWGAPSAADTNTTYTVSAIDSGDNAIIRLTGSDASTDDVTLVAGSNITITPSGDNITIASSASGLVGVSNFNDSYLIIGDGNGYTGTYTVENNANVSFNGRINVGSDSTKFWVDGGYVDNTDTYDRVFGIGSSTGTIAWKQLKTINGISLFGTGDITISDGGGSADLSAVSEDILPSFDEIYDIGSPTTKWYDGYFTNSINLDTISLTNSSGTLAINSDVSVTGDATLGSLLVDTLLLSENTITADASTALQYLGNKGVVEINNSNLDVREGDWIGVPVVETTNSIPPLTTGVAGIIRYNKDEGRFEGYNAEGWASLGGLEKNDAGDNVITGNLVVSGDITSTSDETLKENIKSIEGALDTVTKLSGKMFTMNSDETQKEKVGFIAQEIEQHLPQVVSTDPNGIKSVSYGNVTALLVEAIKELNQKIEDLKK